MATPSNWKASVLARREQAAMQTCVTCSLAMSSLIVCTPSALHRKGWLLTSAILPSFLAMFSSCPTFMASPMPQPEQM
jgi:hypothetical protein